MGGGLLQGEIKMRGEVGRDVDEGFSGEAGHSFEFAGEGEIFFVPGETLEFVIALEQVQVGADELGMAAQFAKGEDAAGLRGGRESQFAAMEAQQFFFPELEDGGVSIGGEAERAEVNGSLFRFVFEVEKADYVPFVRWVAAVYVPDRGDGAVEEVEGFHGRIARGQAGLHEADARGREVLQFVAEGNAI